MQQIYSLQGTCNFIPLKKYLCVSLLIVHFISQQYQCQSGTIYSIYTAYFNSVTQLHVLVYILSYFVLVVYCAFSYYAAGWWLTNIDGTWSWVSDGVIVQILVALHRN
jgi:hypothetical protein